jgi:spermidine synthase
MPPKPQFEELDFRQTPLGDLILRRRTLASLDNLEVHEIILGDAFLMSSLFTEVEVALATLGLAATAESFPDTPLDVVVGGLGLGYTARAALQQPDLHSLIVVDYLEPVIEWHQQGLVPLGPELNADPRCSFTLGDFFKLALTENSIPTFDPASSDRLYHAVLLDIDHSPKNLLHERHAAFYSPDGLRQLAAKLHPGGIFALWSDDPPDDDFMHSLTQVFSSCQSHIVPFHNPLQDRDSKSTVYVAH